MGPLPPGLRWWREEDAPALAAAWADTEVARWNDVPADASVDVARRWIEGEQARRTAGLAYDAVIVGADDGVLGEVGLANLTDAPRRAEIGFWVSAAHRRTGVAGRGVRSMIDWASGELGVRQVWARSDPANRSANRFLAAQGFDRLGEQAGTLVWGRESETAATDRAV